IRRRLRHPDGAPILHELALPRVQRRVVSARPIADGMRRRHSYPAVTDAAPTRRDLLPLIEAAASVADHAALRPWRIIALRGTARDRLGVTLAEAAGLEGAAAAKMAAKPLRAPLLL